MVGACGGRARDGVTRRGPGVEEGGRTGRRVAGGRKERVVGMKREGGGRSAWGVAVRAGSTY